MPIDHQTESGRPGKRWLWGTCLLLLVIGGGVWLWHAGFLDELLDEDRLIAALRKEGAAGPLLCIAAQFVQVVIFAIPGEITQLAAGYVYGAWRGFLYSIVGIMAGSAFNFYFARIVGRPTLERFISHSTLDKVDHALNSAKGKSALFLLFLLPGAPKDALCYGAGFTAMSLPEFVIIAGLARTPALLASILIGAQASHKDYRSMILIAFVVGIAVLGYYSYERYRNRPSVKR